MRLRYLYIALGIAWVVSRPYGTAVANSNHDRIAHGTWTGAGYAVEGSWKIIREGKRRFIVLSKDFETVAAPDLKIFLSPTAVDKLDDDNATRGSLRVAKLKKAKGAQRYEIPAKVSLRKYASVIIHCERYTKLFAKASLTDG